VVKEVVSGVYLIRNVHDGKVYVGSSVRVHDRWMNHRTQLRAGKHSNSHLQSAWTKFGEDAFEFAVIEPCPEGALIVREVVWVEYHDSMNPNKGYNLEYPDRRGHTEATKQKIAQSHIGNPKCKGHKHSEEFKRRIGDRHKGNQYNKGRVPSAETRRKMSESHKGLLKGKVLSDEHKAKLSAAHKGKVLSKEHRGKLAETSRKAWAKRRKEKPHE
jgi:group I intron endonuclease